MTASMATVTALRSSTSRYLATQRAKGPRRGDISSQERSAWRTAGSVIAAAGSVPAVVEGGVLLDSGTADNLVWAAGAKEGDVSGADDREAGIALYCLILPWYILVGVCGADKKKWRQTLLSLPPFFIWSSLVIVHWT